MIERTRSKDNLELYMNQLLEAQQEEEEDEEIKYQKNNLKMSIAFNILFIFYFFNSI